MFLTTSYAVGFPAANPIFVVVLRAVHGKRAPCGKGSAVQGKGGRLGAQTGPVGHPQGQRAIAGALDQLDQRSHLIGQRQPEALLSRAAALNIIGGGRDHLTC